MRRKLLLYSMMMCFIFLMGCHTDNDDSLSDPAPFENAQWKFYNEVTGEHDLLYFGEDFSFSYHCECGEPVGDFDLYDRYRYDEDQLLITIYNDYDDSKKEIKLLSYNVNHLLLEIDGVLRDFSTIETDRSSNFWSEQGDNYLSGYEMHRTLIDFTDKGMMTAAVNYDTKTKSPKSTMEEYVLAGDAVFFDLTVFSQWKEENGSSYEDSYDVSFTEINREEAEYYFEDGGATAFLWLNDDMEIEKVVFWTFSLNFIE